MSARKHQYQAWIDRVTRGARLSGQCEIFSHRMKKAFPELVWVYGWVSLDILPGVRWPHYYLICPAGGIVDPTAAQFCCRILAYGRWICYDDQPTGYCRWCDRLMHGYDQCPLHPPIMTDRMHRWNAAYEPIEWEASHD